MKYRTSVSRSSRHVVFFIATVIVFVILTAIILKIVLIIQHSTFDGNNQFVLQVHHTKTTDLIVFDPDTSHIITITVTPNVDTNTVLNSLNIPVDGSITTDRSQKVVDLVNSLIFQFHSFHPTITYFDAIRLFLYTHSVIPSNIQYDTLKYPATDSFSQQKINKDLMDQSIYKESKNISVVNASNISGLGNNVATILSHIGANVISVTTSQTISTNSMIIYSGNMSYTVHRLQEILHLPIQHVVYGGIADITVAIGTDQAERFAP